MQLGDKKLIVQRASVGAKGGQVGGDLSMYSQTDHFVMIYLPERKL